MAARERGPPVVLELKGGEGSFTSETVLRFVGDRPDDGVSFVEVSQYDISRRHRRLRYTVAHLTQSDLFSLRRAIDATLSRKTGVVA